MTLLAETLGAVVVPRPLPTAAAPQHLCADKGYDYDVCWDDARSFGYTPHLRARGEELREREQRLNVRPHRWVVKCRMPGSTDSANCSSASKNSKRVLSRYSTSPVRISP